MELKVYYDIKLYKEPTFPQVIRQQSAICCPVSCGTASSCSLNGMYNIQVNMCPYFKEKLPSIHLQMYCTFSLITNSTSGENKFSRFLSPVLYLSFCLPFSASSSCSEGKLQRNAGGLGPEEKGYWEEVIYSQAFPVNIMNKFWVR